MTKPNQSSMSFRNKLLTAFVVFFFLVLILASFFGKKGLLEVYNAQKNKESLLNEIERLEQKKSQLERDIKELESNPKAYEAKARDQLGLVYPDELLVIKPKADSSDPQKKPQASQKKLNIP